MLATMTQITTMMAKLIVNEDTDDMISSQSERTWEGQDDDDPGGR